MAPALASLNLNAVCADHETKFAGDFVCVFGGQRAIGYPLQGGGANNGIKRTTASY
jgi:hypothetical protein